MTRLRLRLIERTALLCLACIVALALPAAAHAERAQPYTLLLSRSAVGGFPDGPSCCASVSRDERIGRIIAFESLADDITAGTRPGIANVFVVSRKPPWTADGSPWYAGTTTLVSRGVGGRAANGASFGVHASGDSAHAPTCVAFLSRASNLVHGDTNRKTDAFVADLASGTVTRVSVSSSGRQSNGSATQVSVDGACTRVAFVSDATNLQPTRGQASARWPGARSAAPAHRLAQAYVHHLDRRGPRSGRLAGLTMLVSRAAGAPSDAGVSQMSLSSNGLSVAYVSAASNLGVPTGGVEQVWESDVSERLASRGRMRLAVDTQLVSRTLTGAAASAPSIMPSIDHDGGTVAFSTLAHELIDVPAGDPAAKVWQVVMTAPRDAPALPTVNSKRGRYSYNQGPDVPGNASSLDPAISEGGQWVFFDSRATNFVAFRQSQAQRLVWRWTDPSLQASHDLTGLLVKSGFSDGGHVYGTSTPSEAVATSARGNFLAFESEDPSQDYDLMYVKPQPLTSALAATRPDGDKLFFGLPAAALNGLPGAGGAPEPGMPTTPGDRRLHQVFMRYVGPK